MSENEKNSVTQIVKLATETGAYPLMVKIKEQAEAQVPKQDEVKFE